jgi:hypothetical protein
MATLGLGGSDFTGVGQVTFQQFKGPFANIADGLFNFGGKTGGMQAVSVISHR